MSKSLQLSKTEDDRYKEFQDEAVECIARDFAHKPHGRFLLVIPTGGGKTHTAVRSIHRLIKDGIIDIYKNKVLWVAHRQELLDQARNTFNNVNLITGDQILFAMRGSISKFLESDSSIVFMVIDEAHHAAADQYLPAFEYKSIGILGLTATPSRHDEKPLQFERESFSIGFPDLVDRGIVLRPEIRNIQGGQYQMKWDDGVEGLEMLNDDNRNKNIIEGLLRNYQDYRKIVIFVGTKQHVKDLYAAICQSRLSKLYNSISWITGEGNSKQNIPRDEFIKSEKAETSSILINIEVLSEGYDDPNLNTVVMARPTRSKLIYMQSMGRAIRYNRDNPNKKAYIVEVIDELPNILYRIDNRWLYLDVTDSLEPAVLDRSFSSSEQMRDVLAELYEKYSVPKKLRNVPKYYKHCRYSMLLFKRYVRPRIYSHFPVLIDRDNRIAITNMFNRLSEKMLIGKIQKHNVEAVFNEIDEKCPIADDNNRKIIYDAMSNAVPMEKGKSSSIDSSPEYVPLGYPWITFVSLRYKPNQSEEFHAFVSDMVNRNEILSVISSTKEPLNQYLIRLPLPLRYSMGVFVTESDFLIIEHFIADLGKIPNPSNPEDHYFKVMTSLQVHKIPLEGRFLLSLVTIAREGSTLGVKI